MTYQTPLKTALRRYIAKHGIDPARDSVLVIGAGDTDLPLLESLGFKNITASNIGGANGHLSLDAESLNLPDNSADIVFAHAVLHHCYSPHKAVLEAVRVSRKHFLFLESHDSLLMRLATSLGAHPTYELSAVIGHNYESGGVCNGPVPNHVYRWTKREVEKTVQSGFPHLEIAVDSKTFFYVEEKWHQQLAQNLLNSVPILRQQGNHFFCAIRKLNRKPWITEKDGRFSMAHS